MKKNRLMLKALPLLATALALLATVLRPGTAGAAEKLKAVTTISDLACIAGEIGGERVRAEYLVSPLQDPHHLEPKPSYMALLRDADLFVKVGLELEIGYEKPILEGSRNPQIQFGEPGYLDASQGCRILEIPTTAVDRSMGDVHPLGNPHYWLDPYNVRVIASRLAERLSLLDPEGKAYYEANRRRFAEKLDETMFGAEAVKKWGGERLWRVSNGLEAAPEGLALGGWAGRLAPFRGRSFVTYHKTFTYLANRFGLEIPIQLEPKPGIPPSPAQVLKVIRTVEAERIKLILLAPFYSRQAAELVASRTGAAVVTVPIDVGGSKASPDCFALMDRLVGALQQHL